MLVSRMISCVNLSPCSAEDFSFALYSSCDGDYFAHPVAERRMEAGVIE